ncbi:MAG: hypothetical protein IPF54_00370 [Draconibacterium sp.]|nr:hypothetical protein [Draconibacterium sp.]
MIKLKLLVILILSLLLLKLHSGTNHLKQNVFANDFSKNELSFEANDNNNSMSGILPSIPVYFNIVTENPVSFSYNAKSKELVKFIIHSTTKNNSNLSFHQFSFFSRYCSVFRQIFLKTACFRL